MGWEDLHDLYHLPTSLDPFQKFITISPQNPKIRVSHTALLLEAAPGSHFSPPSTSEAFVVSFVPVDYSCYQALTSLSPTMA